MTDALTQSFSKFCTVPYAIECYSEMYDRIISKRRESTVIACRESGVKVEGRDSKIKSRVESKRVESK